jgi:hypothetical protein
MVQMCSAQHILYEEVNRLVDNFIKAAEIEIIPVLEKTGAKLIKKAENEIILSIREIELHIYLERTIELYGVVSSPQLKQSVYLSEIMEDYLGIGEKSIYQISERFPMDLCMNRLMSVVTNKLWPLITDERIYEAINIVMQKRKERIDKYNESLIEKAAEKAFKEKRYADVISYYARISKTSAIQKKRLEISKNKVEN